MRSIFRLLILVVCLSAASTYGQFSGNPLSSGLIVSPSRINFGTTKLGEVSSERFLLRQKGKGQAQNVEIRMISGRKLGFKLRNHNCPVFFRKSSKCWVSVEFAPVEAQRARGRVEITSSSGTITVELRGVGTPGE